ncbi:MAG: beta-1,3-glucanase family protein [Acidobacteriota bacterium]
MSFTISLNSQISGFSSDKIFWAIVAKNQAGVFCHMDANGNLIPMTKADNSNPVGDAKNCNGSNTFANYFSTLEALPVFTIPDDAFINSGQIWVSLGDWLPFCVNAVNDQGQATGFAPPTVTNPGLQGYNTIFQMAEFAYNVDGTMHVNADTTAVDDMGFPITMELTDANGTQTVGFTANRTTLFNAFSTCTDKNFQSLVISNLRVLSPEHAAKDSNGNPPPPDIGIPSDVVDYFSSFYTEYIDWCWAFYTNKPVTINISGQAFTGQVQGSMFNFWEGTTVGSSVDTAVLSLAKPQNWEVMQCAGEFKVGNDTQMNIEKFVVAAIYRTVFMETPTSSSDSWCSAEMVSEYFTNAPINHYGKILHDNSVNGLCYAFAFDDVCNQSSSVVSTTTKSLVLTLPAWS